MKRLLLIKDSFTITLIFSILFIIYEKVEMGGSKIYDSFITIFLFFIWVFASRLGSYYIHLYNSQIM